MASSLFNSLNRHSNNMLTQFAEFKKQFTGDPREEVQKLLNSGKMSQAQYNQLSNMAQAMKDIFK